MFIPLQINKLVRYEDHMVHVAGIESYILRQYTLELYVCYYSVNNAVITQYQQ